MYKSYKGKYSFCAVKTFNKDISDELEVELYQLASRFDYIAEKLNKQDIILACSNKEDAVIHIRQQNSVYFNQLSNTNSNFILEKVDYWMPVKISKNRQLFIEQITSKIKSYISNHDQKTLVVCLVGPPGMGKSTIIREIAKSIEDNNIPVYKAPTIRGELVSQASQSIDLIFKQLQAKGISLLIWDEIDNLVSHRIPSSNAASLDHNTTVGTLFKNLDSTPCILLCTTNYEENLDDAFRSRIQKNIKYLPRIEFEDRIYYISEKLKQESSNTIESLASSTSLFSYRDLDNLCESINEVQSAEIKGTPKIPPIWLGWRNSFRDWIIRKDRNELWCEPALSEKFSFTGIHSIDTSTSQNHIIITAIKEGFAIGKTYVNGHIRNSILMKKAIINARIFENNHKNIGVLFSGDSGLSLGNLTSKGDAWENEPRTLLENNEMSCCDSLIIPRFPDQIVLIGVRVRSWGLFKPNFEYSIKLLQINNKCILDTMELDVVYGKIEYLDTTCNHSYFLICGERTALISLNHSENKLKLEKYFDIGEFAGFGSGSLYYDNQKNSYIFGVADSEMIRFFSLSGPPEKLFEIKSILKFEFKSIRPIVEFDQINGRIAVSTGDEIHIYQDCSYHLTPNLVFKSPKDSGVITCISFCNYGTTIIWGTTKGFIYYVTLKQTSNK